jgi:hypothetical protein
VDGKIEQKIGGIADCVDGMPSGADWRAFSGKTTERGCFSSSAIAAIAGGLGDLEAPARGEISDLGVRTAKLWRLAESASD